MDHNATCHTTQVNMPHLNPSQISRYSIYLPQRDGRLSWPWWSVGRQWVRSEMTIRGKETKTKTEKQTKKCNR